MWAAGVGGRDLLSTLISQVLQLQNVFRRHLSIQRETRADFEVALCPMSRYTTKPDAISLERLPGWLPPDGAEVGGC